MLDMGTLAAFVPDGRLLGSPAVAISALATDSRCVLPGSLFIALRGAHSDAHAFVPEAIARGAAAVVLECEQALDVPQLIVADTARALSLLSAAFFGNPSASLRVIGITGTNGKTTTTHLVRGILEAAGLPCGVIGTLGATLGGRAWSLENTTPLALELQSLLATMRDGGARAVAMEVSSHALALHRVDDVRFAVAAFTNLTRDHLDFHQTAEAYEAAKRKLFDFAPIAVLNVDDATGVRFASDLRARGTRTINYAIDGEADLVARDVVVRGDGSTFRLDGALVRLAVPGRFNIYNALGALGIASALDVPRTLAIAALATIAAPPGRMERISSDGIDAIVDYAHTPDALANVLSAAREGTRGRLVVVFGCGGDRDSGKRPQMGAIASRLADVTIVTSDNPRSEDPQAIAAAIVAGGAATIELDRRVAIREAIASASAGDVIVIAGKGHETYQIVGEMTRHFDDREEVRAAFAARAGAAC